MSLFDTSEYQMQGVIGKGKNQVIKIKHFLSKQQYALKVIVAKTQQQDLQNFEEVLSLSRLNHPNILPIIGFDKSIQKQRFEIKYVIKLLMPIMKTTLSQEIINRSKTQDYFSELEIKEYIRQSIDALCYCQQLDISHRDIKSENYLLDHDNSLKLCDFSESLQQNEIRNICKSIKGTPDYMAPELKQLYLNNAFSINNIYNPYKSDLYSLGIVLVEVCSLNLIKNQKLFDVQEQLEQIHKRYGDNISSLLQMMVQENSNLRMDFIGFHNSDQYQQIIMNVVSSPTKSYLNASLDIVDNDVLYSKQQAQQEMFYDKKQVINEYDEFILKSRQIIEDHKSEEHESKSEEDMGMCKQVKLINLNENDRQKVFIQVNKCQTNNSIDIEGITSNRGINISKSNYYKSSLNLIGLINDQANSKYKQLLQSNTINIIPRRKSSRASSHILRELNNEKWSQQQQQQQKINKQKNDELKMIQMKKDLKKRFNLLLQSNLMEMEKQGKYQDIDIQNTEVNISKEVEMFFISIQKQNSQEQKQENEKVLYQIIDKLQVFKKTLQDLKESLRKENKAKYDKNSSNQDIDLFCQ